jgi:hypothetical protein
MNPRSKTKNILRAHSPAPIKSYSISRKCKYMAIIPIMRTLSLAILLKFRNSITENKEQLKSSIPIVLYLSLFWLGLSTILSPYLSFEDESIYYPVEFKTMGLLGVLDIRSSFGHPPLFQLLMKFVSDFTGHSALSAHYVCLSIYTLMLLSFYLFLQNYIKPFLATLSVITFSLAPALASHAGFIIPNHLLSLFYLLALFAFLHGYRKTFWVLLWMAIATRESALAATIAFIVIDHDRAKNFFSYLLALASSFIPLLISRLTTGSIISNRGYLRFLEKTSTDLDGLFLNQVYQSFIELTGGIFYSNTVLFPLLALTLGAFTLLKSSYRILGFVGALAIALFYALFEDITPHLIFLNTLLKQGFRNYSIIGIWFLVFFGIFMLSWAALKIKLPYNTTCIQKPQRYFNDHLKHILTFTIVLTTLHVGFFSLYRDSYFRDVITIIPIIFLSIIMTSVTTLPKRILITLLLLTIGVNARSLIYPHQFNYPYNLNSR